jgi:hypothetical protein
MDNNPLNEETLVNNDPPPPDYNNQPPTLDGVKEPSTYGRAWFYGVTVTYRLYYRSVEGHTDVRCIYQQGRLEVYSLEDNPETLGLIRIGYLEAQIVLQHVQNRHIVTWIPRSSTRTIIAKLIRTVLPELLGKTFPTPQYITLPVDEYIHRETYHDCTCSCNH